MSIDWRARRERASRNKPRLQNQQVEMSTLPCAGCHHERHEHVPQPADGMTSLPCTAPKNLKPLFSPHGIDLRHEPCTCTDFVLMDSECTCGHSYQGHGLLTGVCVNTMCHCRRFTRRTL